MKTYRVLNLAQHHEDVLGSGGVGLRFRNLGARWRWVLPSGPGRFIPGERNPSYPLDRWV